MQDPAQQVWALIRAKVTALVFRLWFSGMVGGVTPGSMPTKRREQRGGAPLHGSSRHDGSVREMRGMGALRTVMMRCPGMVGEVIESTGNRRARDSATYRAAATSP
jgi:hypothetical protein